MSARICQRVGLGAAAAMLLASPVVQGETVFESLFGRPDWSFDYGGFFRTETAISITSQQNPWTGTGNEFNGKTIQRNGASPIAGGLIEETALVSDTVTKPFPSKENPVNMNLLRGETKFNIGFTDKMKLHIRMRAVGDTRSFVNESDLFNINDVPIDHNGPPSGRLHGSSVNFFEYRYDSCKAVAPIQRPVGRKGTEGTNTDGTSMRTGSPTVGGESQSRSNDAFEARQVACVDADKTSSPLEFAGRTYMVDFPQLYLDYHNGPLLVRMGNQQIAWGDMLFFRVLDVPNGIDLRRHSLLDLGAEEYSDKRVPSLGVRASYSIHNGLLPFDFMGGWEADAYVQRFRPTIFGNPNTPYTALASQFTIRDQFKQYDNDYNYGIRLRGPIDLPLLPPLDLTLMANRRYNQFGVLQLTDHDVVGGLDPDNNAGTGAESLAALQGQFAGEVADVFFEPDPSGVVSAEEYIKTAGDARVDWFSILNSGVAEFPAAEEALVRRSDSLLAMKRQVDLFHQVTGGLRGTVTRKYFRENNFGLGLGFTIDGPDTWMVFDQVNTDIEFKYTPDRKYTNPETLSAFDDQLLNKDEWELALVMQQFVRYSRGFPAAFVIFEYLHRSQSDLFNRHLSGFGADTKIDNYEDPQELADARPDGIGSFNAVAFAFQQPWPNRIFRLDFATLFDTKGGILVQPAFRWKPNTAWTIQTFLNFVDTVYGNPNDNALSTLDFADEVTVRVEYQF